jgi:hypothetical protein
MVLWTVARWAHPELHVDEVNCFSQQAIDLLKASREFAAAFGQPTWPGTILYCGWSQHPEHLAALGVSGERQREVLEYLKNCAEHRSAYKVEGGFLTASAAFGLRGAISLRALRAHPEVTVTDILEAMLQDEDPVAQHVRQLIGAERNECNSLRDREAPLLLHHELEIAIGGTSRASYVIASVLGAAVYSLVMSARVLLKTFYLLPVPMIFGVILVAGPTYVVAELTQYELLGFWTSVVVGAALGVVMFPLHLAYVHMRICIGRLYETRMVSSTETSGGPKS